MDTWRTNSLSENRLKNKVIKLEKTKGKGAKRREVANERAGEQRLAWPWSSKSRNGVTGQPGDNAQSFWNGN